MQKHFFAYRKWQHGRQTEIQIEVVVAANVPRREARIIADEEIAALSDGRRQHAHEALRTQTKKMEQTVQRIPDYRFIGAN